MVAWPRGARGHVVVTFGDVMSGVEEAYNVLLRFACCTQADPMARHKEMGSFHTCRKWPSICALLRKMQGARLDPGSRL